MHLAVFESDFKPMTAAASIRYLAFEFGKIILIIANKAEQPLERGGPWLRSIESTGKQNLPKCRIARDSPPGLESAHILLSKLRLILNVRLGLALRLSRAFISTSGFQDDSGDEFQALELMNDDSA